MPSTTKGRKWFNDGIKEYVLPEEEGLRRKLQRGKLQSHIEKNTKCNIGSHRTEEQRKSISNGTKKAMKRDEVKSKMTPEKMRRNIKMTHEVKEKISTNLKKKNIHLVRYEKICCEDISKIEGYEEMINDKLERKWILHHRLETHDKWGNRREEDVPQYILEMLGLYKNRPASELIFVTASQHMALHNPRKYR